MATITTRIGKGDPLTFTEMDDNLSNLNSDKLENINNESIGDLSDVDTTGITDGQALLWDTTNSKFVAGDAGADLSTSSIDDLSDVDRASIAEGDVLMWDSVNSKFIAASQYGSGGSTITGNVTSIDDVRQPNTLTLDTYSGISSGDQITFSGTDATSAGLSTSTTYYIFADIGAGAFEISVNNTTALSLTDFGTISDLTYSVTTTGSTGFLLENLGDVTVTTPTDGSILTYNSTNSEWSAQSPTGGSLSSLSDVAVAAPTDGMTLQYSTSTNQWEGTSGGGGASVAYIEGTTASISNTTFGTNQTYNPSWSETLDSDNIVSLTTDGFEISNSGTYLIEIFWRDSIYATWKPSASNRTIQSPWYRMNLYDNVSSTDIVTFQGKGQSTSDAATDSIYYTGLGSPTIKTIVTLTSTNDYYIRYNSYKDSQSNTQTLYLHEYEAPMIKITKLS